MCGVAGTYQQSDGKVVVNTMIDCLGHRGPDACGVLEIVDPTTDVCLAHRRLSIIDLTQAADQPLVKDGLTLSYNGELYNYRVLREELQRTGVRFTTSSDTEVVLEAWRAWGPACLERFRGMFAFAIHDARTGSLTLARDPLGIKPLYVYPRGNGVVFASELKAIVAAVGPELRVDPTGMIASTLYYWLPPQHDAVLGVHKLPAGSWTEYRRDGSSTSRVYWDPVEVAARAAAGPAADLHQVIASSVAHHLVADVPVASFLSGGLDSSIVTALAARQDPSIEAYTIAFRQEDQKLEAMPDDAHYARKMAAHLGIKLHEIEIAPDIVDLLPRMVDILDEPIGDPAAINTLLMCDAARELRGQGAAVRDGRRRAVRRLPQAPREPAQRAVPQGAPPAAHRRHRAARGADARGRERPGDPHRPVGAAVPQLRRAAGRRRRSGAATRCTVATTCSTCSTPSWPAASTASSTATARCTPTTRGWPTTSTGCASRTRGCSCRASTSPTPTGPAWPPPPRCGCRSSTRWSSRRRSR